MASPTASTLHILWSYTHLFVLLIIDFIVILHVRLIHTCSIKDQSINSCCCTGKINATECETTFPTLEPPWRRKHCKVDISISKLGTKEQNPALLYVAAKKRIEAYGEFFPCIHRCIKNRERPNCGSLLYISVGYWIFLSFTWWCYNIQRWIDCHKTLRSMDINDI